MKRESNLAVSPPPPDSSLTVTTPTVGSAMSSSSPTSIELPDLVKIRVIGIGGSGTVHHVRHSVTGQSYALKIIGGSSEDSTRIQISREINILREADSPFIIKHHAIFEEGDETKILLEYMDKGHIGSLGRIPEPKLSKFARQILLGLTYLHGKKIVHCDIKPMNILMDTEDHIKICDFGLSQKATRICQAGGTFAYMSPEWASEKFSDGYANDIWGLGVSLLECYLGKHPLKHDDEELMDWPCMLYLSTYNETLKAPPGSSV
ncbi:mitogen-activated protein kinase kinase 7-like [Magnolia sinica]|uniref:mitogen-activated protein kinase kinase 7-like n=1 Tax=Magnolia sinica TaxID=86752 RepID=UPI002659849C|nr:mitogen-activated protein kinase kinase 7-like [Magnolia sinica]